MKAFIDIGGYDGVSVEFFRKYHPQAKEFKIFTFECDPRNIKKLEAIKNITLIKKAAWIFDGLTRYYYGKDDGGSMYGSKRTGGISPEKSYMVPCIDLGQWMQKTFSPDDHIIMKMNCEGAEYNLIPHLAEHKLLSWVNTWFVQWHNNKITLPEGRHEAVSKMIKWHPWEAQLNDPAFVTIFLRAL